MVRRVQEEDFLSTPRCQEVVMQTEKVYRYFIADYENTAVILSPRAATAAAIAKIENARPIRMTAEEVEGIRLDGDGFLVV
jgi:hypothetical protein